MVPVFDIQLFPTLLLIARVYQGASIQFHNTVLKMVLALDLCFNFSLSPDKFYNTLATWGSYTPIVGHNFNSDIVLNLNDLHWGALSRICGRE